MPEQLKIGFYITVVLVGILLYKKKKPRPTQLDLSGFKNKAKNKGRGKGLPGVRKVTAEVVDEAPDLEQKHIFVHEGKKYNSWRVLNLPMGAGPAEIKKAYAVKLQGDPSLKSLYSKAYNQLWTK